MHLLLDIQVEKLPFVLELVQQLDGVNIIRMENNQLPQIAQQITTPIPPPTPSRTTNTGNLEAEVSDLQQEMDDLFGKG